MATLLLSFPCSILFQMWTSQTTNELVEGPLLLSSLPWDGFFQDRSSSEGGLLFSELPWSFSRCILCRKMQFWFMILQWTSSWWTSFRWTVSALLARRTFHGAIGLLQRSLHNRLARTSLLPHLLPTSSDEFDFGTKHLMAFVFAAAWELRLHLTRWDFGLPYGELAFLSEVGWRLKWRRILKWGDDHLRCERTVDKLHWARRSDCSLDDRNWGKGSYCSETLDRRCWNSCFGDEVRNDGAYWNYMFCMWWLASVSVQRTLRFQVHSS